MARYQFKKIAAASLGKRQLFSGQISSQNCQCPTLIREQGDSSPLMRSVKHQDLIAYFNNFDLFVVGWYVELHR